MTPVLFIGFFVLLVLGFPVAFALAVTGFSMMLVIHGVHAFAALPTIVYDSLESFTLIAIPLFILMANILIQSGTSRDLYDMVFDWVGHLPGGLAITTVLFCAGFSAISGSSVATAATIGMLALPEMLHAGYDRKFSFGIVASGGTIGILIPPSLFMILYGSLTDESVGKLFIAGIFPGLIMIGLFLGYTIVYSRLKRFQSRQKASMRKRWASSKAGIWGLALPVIIIGGIYSGIFTPTEAAAVAVAYSGFVAFAIKRIPLSRLKSICLQTLQTTSMIFFIIIGALIFGHIVTILQVPQQIITFLGQAAISPLMFIIFIGIIFIFLGDFLEVVSITLITLPLIYPILLALGIDPIWFAVIMCINMEFALITPPVGLNLFVINGIVKDANLLEVFKGTLPFMILMLLTLMVVIAFPFLSTYLPGTLR